MFLALTAPPTLAEAQEKLEGRHVVVISRQLEIVKDPEAWIGKLDLAYEAMTEITAGEAESVRAPDGKITIIEDPSVEGAAYAGNPIRIAPELLRFLIDNAWNARGDPGFGLIHELGHDFQSDFPGFMLTEDESRVPEAFANLLLCYAYEKIQPPFILIERGFNGIVDLENNFYIQRAMNYLSGPRSFKEIKRNDDAFVGLLLMLRDEYGWRVYHDAFAAHRSLSGDQVPTSEIEKLQLFLSLLSKAAGKDLRDRFSEWGFPVSLEKAALVEVVVSPSSVMMDSGEYKPITYIFRETNGVGLKITSRISVFRTTAGVAVSEGIGPYSNDIRVNALSSAHWVDNVYLPPDIAGKAESQGFSKLILVTAFAGRDDNGNDILVRAELEIELPSGRVVDSYFSSLNFSSAATVAILAGALILGLLATVMLRRRRTARGVEPTRSGSHNDAC